MDWLRPFSRHLFCPLYDRRWGLRLGGPKRELGRSQHLPLEEIEKRQWRGVKSILSHAFTGTSFYRDRLTSLGLTPSDVDSRAVFEQIPILTKDDLRDHSRRLLCPGFDPETLYPKRTGGSTGVPVRLYWDASARNLKTALTRRHDAWSGYAPGMRRASVWGDTEKKYSRKERIHKFLCERTLYLDTLLMDDVHLRGFVDDLRRYRPSHLFGHAHSLFFLAQFLDQEGIGDIRFEAVISSAETLRAEERRTIEKVFDSTVFDRYGCEEVSIIASECEAHDGLHVAAEGLYVEVLDGGEESPGRVVVTDLANRAMPLIRYEVGDLATWREGPCRCGRGLPRLGEVAGRITDILYAVDGRRISGVSILDTFMIHISGIKQAQLIQERLDHLRLLVVPDEQYGQETSDGIAAAVRRIFGEAMTHEVGLVEKIARTPSGKFRFTVCRIEDPLVSRQSADGG